MQEYDLNIDVNAFHRFLDGLDRHNVDYVNNWAFYLFIALNVDVYVLLQLSAVICHWFSSCN